MALEYAMLRPRWVFLVLFLAALHMLAFDRGMGGDGWAGFAALESLAGDGDLHLEDDHRGVLNGLIESPDGHLVMQYPPGILLLDALPFLAGRGLDRLLPASWLGDGALLPPVGRVPRQVFLEVVAIVLARNAAALLGLLWTAQALLRLGFPDHRTSAAVALAFFGGPLLFYSLVGMTHAPAFALAALLFLLLVRHREEAARGGGMRFAAGAGFVLGFAVLVRYGSIALLPAALLALGRPNWKRWLAFGAAAGLPLLLLPPYWRVSWGTWLPPGYGGDLHLTLSSPWNVLFSPVHGLFLFHPALLAAAAGLLLAAGREVRGLPLPRSGGGSGRGLWPAAAEDPSPSLPALSRGEGAARPPMAAVSTVWFIGVAVLHGWWSEWPNAGGYGQRFLIDALPALAFGLAAFLSAPRGAAGRRVAAGAAWAGAAVGYVLFFAAVGGLVPPPAPYPWPQRLADYAPLVRNPPAPGEIWRGLVNASFGIRSLSGSR